MDRVALCDREPARIKAFADNESWRGKFNPRAVPELIASMPVALRGLLRGKITLRKALTHPHKASKELRAIFERIESKPERYELNLYVSGTDEDNEPNEPAPAEAIA